MRPQFNNQQGFTLLELLVALSLSALVAMMGAMALGAGADFYARSDRRLRAHVDAKGIERLIRVEWQARAKRVEMQEGRVEFDTVVSTDERHSGGIVRVRYECQQQADGTAAVSRSAQVMPNDGGIGPTPSERGTAPAAQSEPSQSILLVGLTSCEFAALRVQSPTRSAPSAVWNTTWTPDELPPHLLRVKFSGERGDVPYRVFLAGRS